jgi:hypothetical protein
MRWTALYAALMMAALTAPGARAPLTAASDDLPSQPFAGSRSDTTWFGGDDGGGIAFAGGAWDWDTGIPPGDTLQGWTAVDATENPAVYFGRATADSFIAHGDPCVPIYDGGMLWCGVHEDEAIARGFANGMGYQNYMCQRAFSPGLTLDPTGASVEIEFLYFNDTETGFDFTRLYAQCYNASAELIREHEITSLTGVIGSFPSSPATGQFVIPAGTLPANTASIVIEFRTEADFAVSDEDGDWDSACGPFGVDDIVIDIYDPPDHDISQYDFGDGPQGWSFEKCGGQGTYVSIIGQDIWEPWADEMSVHCAGYIAGNALCFVDRAGSPYSPPGLPPSSHQTAFSGPVPRAGYEPPEWNSTEVVLDWLLWTPSWSGTAVRLGYSYYPFEGEPRWSPRMGSPYWIFRDPVDCDDYRQNFSTLATQPIPVDWESTKVVFEAFCSCDAFGVDSALCYEGSTSGTPLIDNVRVALSHIPDAPVINLISSGRFQDGFGMHFPDYLEPSDRGNASIALNHSGVGEEPYLGDSTVVTGPVPVEPWLVDLCIRIPRTGPRQDLIPGYLSWKARLNGDPELDWVPVVMDSVPLGGGGSYNNKFGSYFHEDDPGFDPAYAHYTETQEILPDDVFVPGTRIEYYFRSYWHDGGAPPEDYRILGPYEFDILPTMMTPERSEYDVVWPSILFVDAYQHGIQKYFDGTMEQLGIDAHDRYDYLNSGCGCTAPLKRIGNGNNGCTLEQLLGYRLILVNTGPHWMVMKEPDLALLEEWLTSTQCGVGDIRRGLILDGDHIAVIAEYHNPDFMHVLMGAAYVGAYTGNPEYCVDLAAPPPPLPLEPIASLYDNRIMGAYGVLAVNPGIDGAMGSLVYAETADTWTEFASVWRDNASGEPGEPNWRSVIHGFSFYKACDIGCGGASGPDSACIVQGAAAVLGRDIDWILEGSGQPLVPWRYGCVGTEDVVEDNHLAGAVNYLYAARPNPFTHRADIRFHLASGGQTVLKIHDVAGRLVRKLVDGALSAGEHRVVWDGQDNAGRPVQTGIYWMRLQCGDGHRSSQRVIALK